VYTIIGGLDSEGKGAVYSFDPVGSYEREQCRAGGAAASLIMPFLDNQVRVSRPCYPCSSTLIVQSYVPACSLLNLDDFVVLVTVMVCFLLRAYV